MGHLGWQRVESFVENRRIESSLLAVLAHDGLNALDYIVSHFLSQVRRVNALFQWGNGRTTINRRTRKLNEYLIEFN